MLDGHAGCSALGMFTFVKCNGKPH